MPHKKEMVIKRSINEYNMMGFKTKLSNEKWEPIYNTIDVNDSFNLFLNTLLRHFNESFPITKRRRYIQNTWITSGIKISCRNKRSLYMEVKNSLV
jgi:hypothetical protein